MTRFGWLKHCLGLAALCALPFMVSAEDAKPSDAVALFNGRDLTGWKVFLSDAATSPATVWSFSDGVLHLTGKPKSYLRTEKSYSNYHLHLEWRWPANADAKSNSGVLVHINGADKFWPSCIQCQVKIGSTGELIGMGLELPGATLQNGTSRLAKNSDATEKPSGEWNSYEIFCYDDTIAVSVNGSAQNPLQKIPAISGCVGFQMEGYPIELRNVWIQFAQKP